MTTHTVPAQNTLRYYALCLHYRELGFQKEYVNQTTKQELDESVHEVEKMLEQLALKKDAQDKLEERIWNLAGAYRQQGLEDGIQSGIKLMTNVFV
ncbi:MAG: hypothetical protein FWE69_05445 [Clostridiales bacterium]|nr:hypothetical protein [Clostridiales bacterium]